MTPILPIQDIDYNTRGIHPIPIGIQGYRVRVQEGRCKVKDKITGFRFNLNTASDIKRMLSKIASEVYDGKLDNKTANTITYIANTCNGVLKTSELESKIEQIERLLDQKGVIL